MTTDIFSDSKWLLFNSGDAHLTRTSFETKKDISQATLYITALGYFEAYINGNAVSEDKYVPAMTDYEKRDLSHVHMPIFDTMSHRIYYMKYDVTDLLHVGKNVLGTHIGAGWYGQHETPNEGMPKWGDNTLVFTLHTVYADGTEEKICSSEKNTKYKNSYILKTSLYYGEVQDLREKSNDIFLPDFDEKELLPCTCRKAPDALMLQADFPADKAIRSIVPKVIYSFGDRKIYDIGETASGYGIIKFTKKNRNITAEARYADALNEDGSLQFHYCGGTFRMQKDIFISNGDRNELCYPRFLWHAGRYIELTGDAELTEYKLVSTPLKQISFFESDNSTLNWLFEAYVKTQLTNVHGCVPSDCPHRERLGYTGDGQLTCGAVMSVFDGRDLYKKWLRDIRDCQDINNGHIQHTAPFYGGGGGPGGWGGAICIVPWRYYEFYGDANTLYENYGAMKAYIGYMLAHTENGLVTHEEKDGWCLGDWCPPHNDVQIPESFVNTYYLAKCGEICKKTARILGNKEDEQFFKGVCENAKQAIVSSFYDASSHNFAQDIQGANAFAMDIGLGDEITLSNTVKKYTLLGEFDTGIFGTDLLIRVLFKKGYAQLAFDLLTNEKEISFYSMKAGGATTLWENWDGCDSRCHPMFGAVIEYFFSGIAGITQSPSQVGFSHVRVNPPKIDGLDNFTVSLGTPNGCVKVKVSTENGERKTEITANGIEIEQ